METLIISLMALVLVACSGDDRHTDQDPPVVDAGSFHPYEPPTTTPVHVKECTVTKITPLKGCELYDLICDDGDTDMVFLCPITYWDHGPYIPDPEIHDERKYGK